MVFLEHRVDPPAVPHGADEHRQVQAGVVPAQFLLDLIGVVLINIKYQQLLWDEMPLVMLYNGYTFGVQSERFQGYNAFEGGVNNQAVWKWSVKE